MLRRARRYAFPVAALFSACALAASCASEDATSDAPDGADAEASADATQGDAAATTTGIDGGADTSAADADPAGADVLDAGDAAVDSFVPWPALDAASCNCIDAAPKCCSANLCVSTSSPQYGCSSDFCNSCPDYANAQATCADGGCAPKCEFGYGNCDDNPDNGCETVFAADVNHCGACNTPCAARANATMKCDLGSCAIASCTDPFANCNGTLSDGCETDTSSNANHCGQCNDKCRAGLICYQKSCGGVNQASVVTIATGYPLERLTSISSDLSVCQLALDGDDLYFAARNGVFKVSINGGTVTPIANLANSYYLGGVAVDGTYVYYYEEASGLRRYPKAGGTAATVVTGTGSKCLAVDATNLYWNGTGGVFAVDKTSTNVPFSSAPPMKLADVANNNTIGYGLAIDATTVYFTSGNLYSVPIGGGTRQLVAAPFGGARGVVLDADNLYFTTLGGVRQLAKNADAGATISLYPEGYYGLAIDSTHIYVDDYSADLMRVPIGGGAVASLATNQSPPRSVVQNATHVFYTSGSSIYRVTK